MEGGNNTTINNNNTVDNSNDDNDDGGLVLEPGEEYGNININSNDSYNSNSHGGNSNNNNSGGGTTTNPTTHTGGDTINRNIPNLGIGIGIGSNSPEYMSSNSLTMTPLEEMNERQLRALTYLLSTFNRSRWLEIAQRLKYFYKSRVTTPMVRNVLYCTYFIL